MIFNKASLDMTSPELQPTKGETVVGIDVSHWQPAVDWIRAKRNSGVQFMSTKITEGIGSVDLMRHVHVESARAAGVLIGGYHFFHPHISGQDQARFFLDNCPEKLDWYSLDFESHDNLASSVQLNQARRFLDVVEAATGKRPWVYLSPSFANELGNPDWLGMYPLWLANYVPVAHVPKPWVKFDIWQNSERGHVDGLGAGHSVDTNVFNGSLDDLKTLFSK